MKNIRKIFTIVRFTICLVLIFIIKKPIATSQTQLTEQNKIHSKSTIKTGFEEDTINKTLTTIDTLSRPINQIEIFAEFLDLFKTDKQFQLERVVFPLEVRLFQDFDLAPLDTLILKENYYHQELSFREDCFYKTYKKNQKGDLDNNFRTYEILGTESGISVKYTFEIINSKWYLIRLEDMSN